jgi:hypothetical protein
MPGLEDVDDEDLRVYQARVLQTEKNNKNNNVIVSIGISTPIVEKFEVKKEEEKNDDGGGKEYRKGVDKKKDIYLLEKEEKEINENNENEKKIIEGVANHEVFIYQRE